MLVPWMKLFTAPAQQVQQQRIKLNKSNPFWELQEELTNLTTLFLENWRVAEILCKCILLTPY